MNKERSISVSKNTAGDAIVTGLFAGLLAGLAMLAYLVITGLLSGRSPLTEIGLFTIGNNGVPLLGGLMHLAVSGVYGSFFGLIWHMVPSRWHGPLAGWLSGGLYGLFLFALGELVLLPGTGSSLLTIPPVNFAAAHLVFGLVLGSFAR